MKILQDFNRDIVIPFLNQFNYKKIIKDLEEDKRELYERIDELRDRIEYRYQIIYNPNGEDKVVKLTDNLVYIQGKPKWLNAYRAKDVFIVNEEYVDKEWFDIKISPYCQKEEI